MLQEIETALGVSSGAAGLITSMPVLCFAAIGFAGPPLSARFRDAHVLGGALLTMAAGLVLRVAGRLLLAVPRSARCWRCPAAPWATCCCPSLVKRYFPDRTGLLVGAYGTAHERRGARSRR